MNITSDLDESNFTSIIFKEFNDDELLNTTITTTTTITVTSTSHTLFRLFNSTRIFPFLRPVLSTTQTSVLGNQFFVLSSFNRKLRYTELGILSFTLPLYVIVFILFIKLTVLRVNRNTAISGGRSHSRDQRHRQWIRNLIWTSNYVLVDFLNLLYEVVYVIIHSSGRLALKSFNGRLYCQLQVYLPLYLTVLMAYSLTAISIYRYRHFVNSNNPLAQSTLKSLLVIGALWIMPIITSITPAFLLVHQNILKITQHNTTNQCQISYKYESTEQILYIFYRLGNIFILPMLISLHCYIAIYVNLIHKQRRFSQAFQRHGAIRKNLISQILFLFLNFAVWWLPAELIILYIKDGRIKDAAQVTKSLNILLDPIIIIAFDTRFYAAARQLVSALPFNPFRHCFNNDRQSKSSLITQTTIRRRSGQMTNQPTTTISTWNSATNDDITVLESVSSYSLQNRRRRLRTLLRQRQSRTKRLKSRSKKATLAENHV